jgi:hypothetical protein
MIKQFLFALGMNLTKIPVIVAGLFVVPFMYRLRAVPAQNMPAKYRPWLNPEDWTGGYREFPPEYGCVPPDLQERYSGLWGFWKYHALRNGGDGLRNYDWHVARYEEDAMSFRYHKYGYYVEQGIYGSWMWSFTRVKIKFGWRMKPTDSLNGYNPNSIRWVYGAGPTWSFRLR